MSHLDILVPFGLPPKELARDIVHHLQAPALATLLAKGQPDSASASSFNYDDFSRSLPHERWLAHAFALHGDHTDSSPPVGPCLLSGQAMNESSGWWFMVQPVHLHIALDHLVLTDRRTLALKEEESRPLFDAISPLFEEAGMSIFYVDAMHWLLRADQWRDLRTATPDSACGRNIDIWMPQGDAALAWRKLQNEVQMTWFNHPVQAQRESLGLKPVNSLWLWGGGTPDMAHPASAYDVVYNLDAAMKSCIPTGRQRSQAADVLGDMPCRGLLVAEDLITAALAGDWSEWIAKLNMLESQWFAPMLEALRQGRVSSLAAILGDSERMVTRRCTRSRLRRFWIKPSLAGLNP
jgi:hypothetical protein